MAEHDARIRPVTAEDQKFVQFLVGKASMELLAVANRKMYTHPLVISLWVGISSVFVQYMDWWPKPEQGIIRYLAPVPAFGALSIVFMFAIDWVNRWGIEERSSQMLRRPDMVDIPVYYSRSPASGFWILQYKERFIGHIAIDASLDADSEEAVSRTSLQKDTAGKVKLSKGTAQVATIRHFYVDEQYRPAGMADDLLEFALKHAFSANEEVRAVRASESPLQSYIGKALRSHGFRLDRKTEKVGALRWQSSVNILEKDVWASSAQKQQ